MKKIILLSCLLVNWAFAASEIPAQFPSTGDEMLTGLRIWTSVSTHKCADKNCAHFTVQNTARGVAAFEFLHGFIEAARVMQVALDRKVIQFPDEGVDSETLVAPLSDYLDKTPDAKSKALSVSIYLFLKSRYPSADK